VFEDNTDEYRAWAAQCRTMAARAKSDEDRQAWLELAEKWRRLANELSPRNRVRLLCRRDREPFKNLSGEHVRKTLE